jgi:hypothetical protein
MISPEFLRPCMVSHKRCGDRIDSNGSDHGMDVMTVLGLV